MKYKYPILLFACFIVFLLIYNPAKLYFLSDDFDSILIAQKNANILHSFRPLSLLSIRLDYLIWGNKAEGYHFTNILFHLLSTVVLYVFTKQLYLKIFNSAETNQYAFFTSVFFLFYPYHSEPLFWIVGRGGPLCALMSLLSLHFYLKKQEGFGTYFLSLFFFMAAVLSYEAAWILPLIITVISLIFAWKDNWSKEWKYIFLFWTTFMVYLFVRFYLTDQFIGSPYGTHAVLFSGAFSQIRNFVLLVSRSFIPPAKNSSLFLLYFLVLGVFLFFILFKLKKHCNVILKISIPSFIISILPAIPFGIDTHDTESERLLYLPSVFLSISLILILILLFKKQFLVIFSVLLIAEISFLFYNYKSFETSSRIANQTVKAFFSLRNSDYLYCINLPSQYRGAFIFRNGFQSAVKLYTEIKNITILSKAEIENPPPGNYNIDYFELNNALEKGLIDSGKIKVHTVIFNWKEKELDVYK
ncbi:MAG: hypothetical protein Q8891_03615 [Bacteroidota bacterium]|nr:hypothetical protein [Bacteroidota bacterium]